MGESVRFQKFDKKWNPAVIVDRHNDRSFSVLDQNGTIYRRNSAHILPTEEKHEQVTEPAYDAISNQNTPSQKASNVDPERNRPSPEPLSSNSNTSNNPYTTRSGRVVKPKIIPSM